MPQFETPGSRWGQLDAARQGLLDRCERLAALTIPKTCLPEEFDPDSDELQYDYQSIGAQLVNNVVNKLMLAMFAPSRPFVRLEPSSTIIEELAAAGIAEEDVRMVLANTERKMVRELDKRQLRPKMYELLRHLVVTGNGLIERVDDTYRIYGLRHYVVRRDARGRVAEVVLRESLQFQDLEEDVVEGLGAGAKQYQPDTKVHLYRWMRRQGKRMVLDQWVDDTKLPEEFSGNWKVGNEPLRVMVWDLATTAHYGTGLAEDYGGALGAVSVLSEAQLNAAILASEFRWLVNPAGTTKVEDFEASKNGGAIPGTDGDIVLLTSGKAGDLQQIAALNQEYISQLGRGFIMTQSVIRNAERVTAEEVRRQVTELETSLGGIYSRLAGEVQAPVAEWLLESIDAQLDGKDIDIVVVTGLDALSRSGDLDNLRGWLGDLAGLAQLPEPLLARVEVETLALRFAQGWGVDPKGLMKSQEQVQAEQQAAQQAQVAQENAIAQGQADAQASNQPAQEQ